uniref:glucose-6-phosphatase n=1 Tax=Hemiselmis andersenii TaxID=464988 RepID=A0A6U5ACD8_HEMAN|mmetsp:Transcript_18026/g.41714  ORF Transcript_18026/g.41714 Transcript_18026/m.41714 type:complete len:282 (+) Transcript_18026:424-1269(+)
MDPRVRQFGSSTCEVGWGMPSGHMQVTVAVYAVLAQAFRKAWFTACIAILVLVTAISRVHMGAHTPLQVSCGFLSGLVTAWVVIRMKPGIRRWCSREIGEQKRIKYALAAAVAIIFIIVSEYAILEALDMEPSKSVVKATAACRGGVHGTVATGKGIARDTGALVGAAAGRWLYYSNSPRHQLLSKEAGNKLPWLLLLLLWGLSAVVSLRALTAFERLGMSAVDGDAARQVAEAALSGLKYFALLALATGGWATLIGTTKSSVLSERALSFHDDDGRLADE